MSYQFEWIDALEPTAADRDRYAACWQRAGCVQQPACSMHCRALWGQFDIGFNTSSIGTFRQRLLLTGMGFEAKSSPYPALSDGPESTSGDDELDLRWRSQRVPGRPWITL